MILERNLAREFPIPSERIPIDQNGFQYSHNFLQIHVQVHQNLQKGKSGRRQLLRNALGFTSLIRK
jgi:hypothetical protein